ncbi:histidine ammonia-lyase [candidate division WOR-3 bacterium]|nr:histidine ammonia-lyase [candidate division WOR-3 bacterium]
MLNRLTIDGNSLKIEDVVKVARDPKIKVVLSKKAKTKVNESANWVEEKVKSPKPIYGVNTGIGSKENIKIPLSELDNFQEKIILSHSSAVGNPLPEEVVRATMLLRANTLAKGYSGIRLKTIETLLDLLNLGVYPVIPEKGSVGASGDLSLLSHLSLVLIGKGEANCQGQRMSGLQALRLTGIKPIKLKPKEGLALINGNQVSTAIAAIAVKDSKDLLKNALIASSLTLEALKCFRAPFRLETHRLRPYPGMLRVARAIQKITQGSKLLDSDTKHIQDAYSLRCIPQVLGPIWDIIEKAKEIITIEINSATDNPLVFPGLNKTISGGNFHGEPIALWMDILGLGMANLGNISERRIFRLLSHHLNKGLPSFLVINSGLESGFALAQYTAASLVSENKVLAYPASVDSIPTCESQEDYVSMAPTSARTAREIISNVEQVIAIEFLVATQAIDLRLIRHPLQAETDEKHKLSELGKGTLIAYKKIREKVPFLNKDREIYKDIKKVLALLKSQEILKAVKGI